MQIKELRKDYEEYSVQIGNLNRHLVYAGIAIIWLFRVTDNSGTIVLPNNLHAPLLMLVTSFLIEFIQKLYQTLVTYAQYLYFKWRYRSENNVEDKVVCESELLAFFSWVLWCLKFVPTLYAYVLIGKCLSVNVSEFSGLVSLVAEFFQ